jgi:hypothetical protein
MPAETELWDLVASRRGHAEVTRTARTRTAAAPWSFTLPRTAERLYNTP